MTTTAETEEPQLLKNMEDVLTQLTEFQTSLRKKDSALRAKIDAEHKEMEKIALRRDFYKELQTNITPKHNEALDMLNKAERALDDLKKELTCIDEQTTKLKIEVVAVIAQNESDVLPELQRLETLVLTSKNEISSGKRACSNDEQRILELTNFANTYNAECDEIRGEIEIKNATLSALPQPESFKEDLSLINHDIETIQHETKELEDNKKLVATEICLQRQRKDELERLQIAKQDELQEELSKLDCQRQAYDDNFKALGEERVTQHSLASLRIEIEMNIAAVTDTIKHETNFLTSIDKRLVNVAKQALTKKKLLIEKLHELIPQMKAKLEDLECQLSTRQSEKSSLEREQMDLRSKVDRSLAALLNQENIDIDLHQKLDETMKLVAEKECHVDQWRAEEKKILCSVGMTKEKREAIRRKIEQVQHGWVKETENSSRLQQLIEIDLRKKNHDAANKTKELTKLCRMIEAEKLQTSHQIKTCNEVLTVLQHKCSDLQVDLRSVTLQKDEKMESLRLLRSEIEASSQRRAASRGAKSISTSSCRELLEEISNEEARLEKLKSTMTLTRKELERLALQNEGLLNNKQALEDQLYAKKNELSSLLHINQTYEETLKQTESHCQKLEAEKNAVELKNNDIKRSIDTLKLNLQDKSVIEEKIDRAKNNLEFQIMETERISAELESPNQDRIIRLEGHDPSVEELQQNLAVLESLEKNNREILRSTVISTKEVTARTEELQDKSSKWKASSQTYLKEINDLQGRFHELQRVRISQLSELQMYSELIEKLTASKAELEHDISFRAELSRKPEREASPHDAFQPEQQVKKKRPTAYLPCEVDSEELLRIPRPFGQMAPFKAISPGSTMRHIRKPQPVPLIRPN